MIYSKLIHLAMCFHSILYLNRPLPSVIKIFTSVSSEVFVQHHSYGNVVPPTCSKHVYFHVNQTYFHMKGFAWTHSETDAQGNLQIMPASLNSSI